MKRLTVTPPNEIATRLDEEQRRRAVPASAIIREAVEHYLLHDQSEEPGFIGIVNSGGIGPQAADVDQFLETNWAAHIATDRDQPTADDRPGEQATRQSA